MLDAKVLNIVIRRLGFDLKSVLNLGERKIFLIKRGGRRMKWKGNDKRLVTTGDRYVSKLFGNQKKCLKQSVAQRQIHFNIKQ